MIFEHSILFVYILLSFLLVLPIIVRYLYH